MNEQANENTAKKEYEKPTLEITPMDRFFFICGMNTMNCGGASDTIRKTMGTCVN